jgi:hypothetical protein
MRAAVLLVLAACGRASEPASEVDTSKIVPGHANLRTDVVGEGTEFASTATFVLVDVTNGGTDSAYVAIGGELRDQAGAAVAELAVQSLWLPAGETRLYALVDTERVARPTATGARALVRGAAKLPPPLARLEDVHEFDDHGTQRVINATLVNDADQPGAIMVVGAFYDAGNRPLTRPFSVVKIGAKTEPRVTANCPDATSGRNGMGSRCTVQLIGPKEAVRGAIFVGDVQY